MALLAAREIEVLGVTQSGTVRGRIACLINAMLHPIEKQWLDGARVGDVIVRVKDLRSVILADLLKGTLTPGRTDVSLEATDRLLLRTDVVNVSGRLSGFLVLGTAEI